MNTVPLSVELINGILGYLGTKPYQEVFQLIHGIQDAAKPAPAPAAPVAPVTGE